MGTNNHGYHGNRYCVNLEEVIDVPENIIFKASPDIRYGVHTIQVPGKTEEENKAIIHDIFNGFTIDHHCSIRSIIMDRDTAFKFMKYKSNYRSFSFKVYNFDEFIHFEQRKAKETATSEEELQILLDIESLQDIKDTKKLMAKILNLNDSPFQRRALLLLKVKAYQIEDEHFLKEKKHRQEDLEELKIFRKTNYSQVG